MDTASEAIWSMDAGNLKQILEKCGRISSEQSSLLLREAIVAGSVECIAPLLPWIVPDLPDFELALSTHNLDMIRRIARIGDYGNGIGVGQESDVLAMFENHTIDDLPSVLCAMIQGWNMEVSEAMIAAAEDGGYSRCARFLKNERRMPRGYSKCPIPQRHLGTFD